MAVQHRWYDKGVEHVKNGDVSLLSDTLKYALLDSNASPSLGSDEFWNAVSGDEVSGTGYTSGGVTLTSKTVSLIDDSAVTAWAASTSYDVGDIVRPSTANGYIFMCVLAGDSGASEPSWVTTPMRETSDGTLVWVNVGASYVRFDAGDPSWTSSTITARYGVVYVDGATPGTDDYLLILLDLGQNESSDSGTFEIQLHPTGLARAFRAA